MTRILRSVLAACFLLGWLTACSSEPEPVDPQAIEATVSTNPDETAGNPVGIKAIFTGAQFSKSTEVTFDIRVDGEPKLVDAKNEGDGVFTGEFAFPKPGSYEVYLHLYVDDLHITKKKLVDVK